MCDSSKPYFLTYNPLEYKFLRDYIRKTMEWFETHAYYITKLLNTDWCQCHHLGIRQGLCPDHSFWDVLNDTIMGGVTVAVMNRWRPWVLTESASEIRFAGNTLNVYRFNVYSLIIHHDNHHLWNSINVFTAGYLCLLSANRQIH